jgi:hypothetical protein
LSAEAALLASGGHGCAIADFDKAIQLKQSNPKALANRCNGPAL